MQKGCCECGKFIRMVQGNFQDDDGEYLKGVCMGCDKIHKIRNGVIKYEE